MFPRVFGHEGAGVVEEVGDDVTGIEVGDHVVLSLASCRACAKCTAGLAGYCEPTMMLNYMGFRMDGSTSYSRDGEPVFGSLLRPVLARPARGRATPTACVVVDKAARPDQGRAVRLRLPGRRRHRPQRRSSPAPTTASSCSASARSGWPRSPPRRRVGVGTIVAVDLMPSRLRGRREGTARSASTRRARRRLRGRQGQGAHRRRRDVRRRDDRGPRGRQAGRSSRSGVQGTLVVLGLDADRSSRSTRSTSSRTARSSEARSRATPTRWRWCRG